jgi:nicotinamide-nucleotide amidase
MKQQTSALPTAIVLNLGTELAQGFVTNTNAKWIAEELRTLGVQMLSQSTLPDDRKVFGSLFRQALSSKPALILITGGLGPTDDDLTRELVAKALKRPLHHDQATEDVIRAYIASRGRPWNDSNSVQAMVPQGAAILSNPVGTAPGLSFMQGPTQICCLPGVPHEMRRMFQDHIAPIFGSNTRQGQIEHLDALFAGIGESTVGPALRATPFATGVKWCSLPTSEGLLIRLYLHTQSSAEITRSALHSSLCALLKTLGPPGELSLVCTDGSGLAKTVIQGLKQLGQTISVAESCTGGMLGQVISSVPGSSEVFLGGIIAYHNQVKISQLGITAETLGNQGAVSESTVRQMAESVRNALGSTYGLATSGVAGPGGGTESNPVGKVWMAIAGPSGCEAFQEIFSGDRDEIRTRSVYKLLNTLRTISGCTQKITCSFEQ